eukprot:9500697-Pyramimonas_sp.AAC.2
MEPGLQGRTVDAKGRTVDAKGRTVDAKGCAADAKGPRTREDGSGPLVVKLEAGELVDGEPLIATVDHRRLRDPPQHL